MEKHVTLLVSALITDRAGRILLTRHGPAMKLHLPDGDVRFGETMRQALVRSVAEDLAVTATPEPKPFLVSETIGRNRAGHYLTFHFRARLAVGAVLKAREGLIAAFFRRPDIGPSMVYASTLEALAAGSP